MKHTKDLIKVIKTRHITEKAKILEELQNCDSNPCVKKCETPKYVFLVNKKANKTQVTKAIEKLYPGVTVIKVNVICLKPKKRRVRRHFGYTSARKKAIVTLKPGDKI